jgi:type V secretory pathway adhesin AidA
MRDITTINWKEPFGKHRSLDVAKQKVFYTQNGIEYDAGGVACNQTQVKKYYAQVATDAQKAADEAKEASVRAQEAADEMLKKAKLTKTAARKG